jgi:hypothetical protein
VLDKLFSRPLHEHADAAQRLLGVQALAPDAPQLAQLLRDDPAPEVRAAAAARSQDVAALTAALQSESDPGVRQALAQGLGGAIAAMGDAAAADAQLDAPACNDAVRAVVADRTQDETRRTRALDAIIDESVLADLALTGAHAPTRLAAAERVKSTEALRRLAEAAQDKDRGVARSARKRVDAIDRRATQGAAADTILAQAEALIDQPGPIVTPAIDIERRWKALNLTDDPARRARWDAAAQALQARFEREHAQQRSHSQFQRRLAEWKEAVHAPTSDTLARLREELLTLRTLAQDGGETAAQPDLDQGEQQLVHWEAAQQGLAGAEALVTEAEQLAAGTPIDDAQLPQRWQALDLSVRTPALTRRFEAALLVIEHRRLAVVRAAQEQASVSRQELHTHLHAAEQALTAGQLQAARTALDATRVLKPAAGMLPKPTMQRLSRVTQQLVELERWQSFGQHSARVQLCERAEKLIGATLDAAQVAAEVQKLRNEWKTLDKEHANVPKSLWERFDSGCEKAYAPAARHFAQLAAQRKEARKAREAFVAVAEAHGPTLLAAEPHDLRAIAHWLQETDRAWHGNDLGSVDPGAWKKLDGQLKAALAPLRAVLAETRGKARAEREALVTQAKALAEKAGERDAPAQVKALQAKWKDHAIASPLAPRDERVLWEQFRAACDAVFNARDSQRKETDKRKREHGRAFEALGEQMERLAHDSADDAEVRRVQRELQTQWKNAATGETPPASLETRFRRARVAVDTMLAGRARSRDAALATALVQKAQVCEELDALVKQDQPATSAEPVVARWEALPALPDAWEKTMRARRDAAVQALSDETAWFDYSDRIDAERDTRAEGLIELEMVLGLDTPADQRALRLAVQVKQLRSRFKTAAGSPGAAEEQLLAWCARPGLGDARDHQRLERIVGALARPR